jgi:phosphomethylpyrimidine synthase
MNVQTKPAIVTTGPISGSRKVFSSPEGRPDIAVPFREVDLHPTANEPPFRLYDTSGPFTDPHFSLDLDAGLPQVRGAWLAGRGFETVAPRAVKPEDNGFAPADRLVPPCPAERAVLAGRDGTMVTQYEFARAGVVTEEMIYVAHRENLGRAKAAEGAAERRADGEDFGAAIPEFITPSSCGPRLRRGGRSFRPISITRNWNR